eukprot:5582768-Pleurochrysis_carterae.AAC.1
MVHTIRTKSSNLHVKPIQAAGCGTRQGPRDLPVTPAVILVVGKRGAGKSTAASSLIRAYAFQKIY